MSSIMELKSYRNPPLIVISVFSPLMKFINLKSTNWGEIRDSLDKLQQTIEAGAWKTQSIENVH